MNVDQSDQTKDNENEENAEEKYNNEDPVQKYKFSHEEKSTFVEDFPEMNVFEPEQP